jgi:hypothetical protein
MSTRVLARLPCDGDPSFSGEANMTGANLATSNVCPEAYCSVAPRPAVPPRRPDEGSFPKQPQWLCADVPDYIDLKKIFV